MKFFAKHGLLLYAVILFLHCFAQYTGWNELRIATKVALMPLLVLYLFSIGGPRSHWLPYAGLIFAFLGDMALLGGGSLYFLLGMAGFILCHVCYAAYFLKLQDRRQGRLREAFITAMISMLVCALMLSVLNPYLGSLRIPVLVYMIIISIMAILAAHVAANDSLRKIAVWYFIPGAALFIVSDASLALNKFVMQEKWMNMLVMATYGIAQLLLAKGFVKTFIRF